MQVLYFLSRCSKRLRIRADEQWQDVHHGRHHGAQHVGHLRLHRKGEVCWLNAARPLVRLGIVWNCCHAVSSTLILCFSRVLFWPLQHPEREFILKFSAMEIYNEAVRDLLSSDATPLRLLDDPEVN